MDKVLAAIVKAILTILVLAFLGGLLYGLVMPMFR
jgi:hypothetical protein